MFGFSQSSKSIVIIRMYKISSSDLSYSIGTLSDLPRSLKFVSPSRKLLLIVLVRRTAKQPSMKPGQAN